MAEVKIYKNEAFGNVRVLIDEVGQPWFVAQDVAKMLGFTNASKAIKDHVDDEDCKILTFKALNISFKALKIRSLRLLWKANDFSDKTLINESGLYSLILRSNLPKAKEFKRWVTSIVLPSIRKTGRFVLPEQTLEWKDARNEGKYARRTLTDAVRDSDIDMHGHEFSTFSDLCNRVAFGMTAKQMRELRNITDKSKLRDALSKEELKKLEGIEVAVTYMLDGGMRYKEIKQVLLEPKRITNKN